MKNNYLYIKEEDGKIVVSSSDGVFSSISTLDDKETFKNYCERKAKEWRESILGNYANWSNEDRKRKSDKWINAENLKCGEYNFYFNIEDKKDIFRKEVDSLAKSLGIIDYMLEINEKETKTMEKIKAYLSKDINGCIDVWGEIPKFNRKIGTFYLSNDSMDIDIIDYPELENLVKEGQCVEITITKGDVVYDYNESPEGKMIEDFRNYMEGE